MSEANRIEANKLEEGKARTQEVCHVHRVGTVTCGLVFIIYGILFLVRLAVPALNYEIIFSCWPIILIFLGIEMLVSSMRQKNERVVFRYDFPAVLLVAVMALFAFVLAVIECEIPYLYLSWY